MYLAFVTAWALAADGPETTFEQRCAVCHGSAGVGDGAAAAALRPPPANLTAARFTTDYLTRVIREGIGGTGMPPGPDLEGERLAGLVRHIQSLGPGREIVTDTALVDQGRALFAIRCASCHGQAADGQGPAKERLAREAASFVSKQPTRERIEDVLDNGVPGTAMTPMRRLLSNPELDAVVAFIQSRFGGA
ncbi:MAG: cytochrome c [Myxococcota bacterium]